MKCTGSCSTIMIVSFRAQNSFELENLISLHYSILKEQCHGDFAVLGQFCSKIITLRL